MEPNHYVCLQCGKKYKSYNKNSKYCSLKCKSESQSCNIDFQEARELYEMGMSQNEIADYFHATQKVIFNTFKRNGYTCRKPYKRNQFGCNNNSWVGHDAKYATLHKRVESLKGKPKRCEMCGTTDPSIRYEWANVTGDYYDIENGYKRMCAKCHRAFDRSEKGIKNNVER